MSLQWKDLDLLLVASLHVTLSKVTMSLLLSFIYNGGVFYLEALLRGLKGRKPILY